MKQEVLRIKNRAGPEVCVVFVFLFSRFFYHFLGVGFDAGCLSSFLHFLDPMLLRSRLTESLFYLHSQPPFFNLLLGIVLKLFPGYETGVFWAAYLVIGLLISILLHKLLVLMRLPIKLAFALAVLFSISPPSILYENWLYSTYPVAGLLVVSAFALHQWLISKKTWCLALFFSALAVIVGTHSTFHLGWFCFWGVFVLFMAGRENRKITLLLTLLFLAIPLSIYTKNLVVFGQFSSSSWLGMNFWAMTGANVSRGDLKTMIREGKLSEVAAIPRFSEVVAYPEKYRQINPFADVPSLTQEIKSTGTANFNHFSYVEISKAYFKDGLTILRYRPELFIKQLLKSNFYYFKSASDFYLEPNRTRIKTIVEFFDYMIFGRLPWNLTNVSWLPIKDRGDKREEHIYLFILLGLPIVVLNGLWMIWRKNSPLDSKQKAIVFYLVANIIYVAMVSNLVEVGENNRMRFVTDPLVVPLIGLFLYHVVRPAIRTTTD